MGYLQNTSEEAERSVRAVALVEGGGLDKGSGGGGVEKWTQLRSGQKCYGVESRLLKLVHGEQAGLGVMRSVKGAHGTPEQDGVRWGAGVPGPGTALEVMGGHELALDESGE